MAEIASDSACSPAAATELNRKLACKEGSSAWPDLTKFQKRDIFWYMKFLNNRCLKLNSLLKSME